MISIVGHSRNKNSQYLFIGEERIGVSRKKTPLQMLARYFGL